MRLSILLLVCTTLSAVAQNQLPSSGNVGVGTTTPQKRLDVRTGSNDFASFAESLTPGQYSGIHFGYSVYNNVGYRKSALVFEKTDNASRGKIHLLNNADNNSTSASLSDSKLTIDFNGKTGVGVTSPEARLHVKDGLQQFLILTGTNSSGYKAGIGVNDDGVNIHNNSSMRGFNFRNNGGQTIRFLAGPNSSAYELLIGVNDNGVNFSNNSTERGFNFSNSSRNLLKITPAGVVGIGTTLSSNPNSYLLAVNGTVGAKEVHVENTSSTWADYVFEIDYKLRPLAELEDFIKKNKHLPEIPSKQQVQQDGHKLGEMDVLLLKKVEELTLYILEQQKEIEALKKEVTALKSK